MRQTEEIILSDDPLLRIQAEISEVEKREIELRNEHRNLALKTAETTPPVSPTNSDKTNEDQQSDDSGFVVSPTANKKFEAKNNFKKNKIVAPVVQPVTTLHKPVVLTRAMSTPQLFQVSPLKKFNMNPSQKGIMQRFIASRGKMVQHQQNHFQSNLIMSPIELNSKNTSMLLSHVPARPTFVTMQSAPAAIERDEKGRPIRRGFVPVEEKIQCELRDLKCRETELKQKRKQKLRESKTNLLDYDESYESNDDELNNLDMDEDEVDYPPMFGKLRAAKSIDALNNSSSLSPRDTPSPLQFERINNRYNQHPVPQPRKPTSALKPAVSLAQLCDLDPKEAPSSHKLIERWEKMIEQKQLKDKQAIIH